MTLEEKIDLNYVRNLSESCFFALLAVSFFVPWDLLWKVWVLFVLAVEKASQFEPPFGGD